MSKGKQAVLDPEQTLQTLDQLSQAIDVMSQVITRLRRQVSRQLRQDSPCEPQPEPGPETGNPAEFRDSRAGSAPEEFGLEIGARRPNLPRRQSRVLH